MLNPDGVVVGNYRSDLQGKDPHRHYFADSDCENHQNRALEVENLRYFLNQKFTIAERDRLKMFLDIHGHSADNGIFIYGPLPETDKDRVYVERFSKILDNCSPYFSIQ